MLILQSSPVEPEPWVRRCLDSVQSWAKSAGYGYSYVNDELFERVPDWYRKKLAGRTPIIADLARLLWAEEELDESADVVAWLDADVLIWDPALRIEIERSPVFGVENWVQGESGGFKVRKNVHNAYCAFRSGCRTLPFLIDATTSIIERVDPDYIAPQMVGPKLLTSLHNIVGFELEPRVGAISPELGAAIVDGHGEALAAFRRKVPGPLAAGNLCASLAADRDMDALVDQLVRNGMR